MGGSTSVTLRPFAPGLILALFAILFGFLLGGAFGAAETSIKEHLDASGSAVLSSVYHGDTQKKDAVVKKSWQYMKRAHLHGGVIGAAVLASIILPRCRPLYHRPVRDAALTAE